MPSQVSYDALTSRQSKALVLYRGYLDQPSPASRPSYAAKGLPSSSSHSRHLALLKKYLLCMNRPPKRRRPKFAHCKFEAFEGNASGHMAYPNKIGVPRLNVEIQEIEDDPVRKITEAAIIDNQSLPCINHLTFK